MLIKHRRAAQERFFRHRQKRDHKDFRNQKAGGRHKEAAQKIRHSIYSKDQKEITVLPGSAPALPY